MKDVDKIGDWTHFQQELLAVIQCAQEYNLQLNENNFSW